MKQRTYKVDLASQGRRKVVYLPSTRSTIISDALDAAHKESVKDGGKEWRVVNYEVAE